MEVPPFPGIANLPPVPRPPPAEYERPYSTVDISGAPTENGHSAGPTVSFPVSTPTADIIKVEPMDTNSNDSADVVLPVARPIVYPQARTVGGGSLPLLEQTGELIVGPGARREAQMLGIGLPKLRSWQREAVEKAKRYAMEQSVKQILLKQTVAHQQNQQKIAMYAQALSLMARVYIGSVSIDVREENIRTMFAPFGPIKHINMTYDTATGHHKGFAFVEYEVPEGAELASQQMNGVLAGGKNMRVGKPSNMPQAQPIIEQILNEGKSYHRVYVASIHPDLSETDLRSVFSAFGNVTDCTLAKLNSAGTKHRGYGYITYDNEKSAQEAVASMNLFDLGGMYLRVGRAITPPSAQVFTMPLEAANLPTASALAAAAITAKICAMEANVSAATLLRPLSPGHPAAPGNPFGPGGSLLASIVGSGAPRILIGDVQTNSSDNKAANEAGVQHGGSVFAVPPPGVVMPTQLAGNKPASPAQPPPQAPVKPAEQTQPTGKKKKKSKFGGKAPPELVPPPTVIKIDDKPGYAGTSAIDNSAEYGAARVGPYGAPLPDQPKIGSIGLKDPVHGGTLPPVVEMSAPTNIRDSVITESMLVPVPLGAKVDGELARAAIKKSKKLANNDDDDDDDERISKLSDEADRNLTADQKELLNQGSKKATLSSQEYLSVRGNEQRTMLMQKLMKGRMHSSVVILKNMVTAAEVDEYLEAEVTEECSKYGKVAQVIIFQEKYGETIVEIVVKIFVRFSTTQEAEKARSGLDGRFFAGRTLKAELYDQALFDHNDFSG